MSKNPGFALAVLITLTLGIGVKTTVFSLVNGFLLRPLPYPEPHRLGVLLLHEEGVQSTTGKFASVEDDSHGGETWNWVRDNVPALEAASYGGTNGVNLRAGFRPGADSRYVHDMRVSAHYFEVLGLPLLFVREFTEEEDRQGGPPVVVLSYELWQSAFHRDRHEARAVHSCWRPAPHAQTTQTADVWTPLRPAPTGECGGNNCGIIVRLRPGAIWQQADAQLSHLRKPLFDELEAMYKGHAWFHVAIWQEIWAGRRASQFLCSCWRSTSFC